MLRASWRRTVTSLPATIIDTPGRSAPSSVANCVRHAPFGVAGEHEHVAVEVGEERDDGVERLGVDGVERGLDVRQLGRAVAGDRLVAAELADALGGRPQLAREVVLDRRLQGAEAVEAELGGQAHDGGGAGAGGLGEVGDGAEADELGSLEHHVGDAPLGRRQLRAGVADPLLDLHLGHGAEQ